MSLTAMLLESTVKASVVMLAALIAVACLRRRSAALRHWILSAAIVAAMAAPLLGRPVEEGLDEVLERRPARGVARHGGGVDIAEALLVVPDVPFVFEDAQLRPHGGVVRGAGQRGHALGGRGAADAIQDVHDLALAAGEGGVG